MLAGLMAQAGLRLADPVEFAVARDGLVIRPLGAQVRSETLRDVARRLAAADVAGIEFDPATAGGSTRETEL